MVTEHSGAPQVAPVDVAVLRLPAVAAQHKPAATSLQPAVPTCFLCQQPMQDPVVVSETGHTYCRGCIEEWWELHDTCPASGSVVVCKSVTPNYIMRDIINQGLRQGEKLVYLLPTPASKPPAPAAAMACAEEEEADNPDFDTLLELLSSEVPDLQEEALRMAGAVTEAAGPRLQQLLDSGVVLGLATVLDKGSESAQSSAVDLLAAMMEVGPPNVVALYLEAGVVSCLVAMLLSPSVLCQTQAIGMLARLSKKYACAVRIAEEGGLGPVVQYLLGDNVTSKEYASVVLAEVVRHDEELAGLVAHTEDAGRALVALLRSGNSVCQHNAAFVLGQLAGLGPAHEAAVAWYPVIDPLVQMLYFSAGDTKLYAAQLLVAMCRNHAGNRGMVALAGGVSPLLKMLVDEERSHALAAGELLVFLEQVKEARKDVQTVFKGLDKVQQKEVKKAVKALRLKLKLS